MKFLSILKQKEVMLTLPPAVGKQLIKASMAGMKQLKKEGKLLESYSSPSGLGVVILNYNSADEWIKDQNLIPLLTYYSQEIYPLADMEDTMKSVLEALKAAK
jgi:hypothetical protein